MVEKSTEVSIVGKEVGKELDRAAAEVIRTVAGETSQGIINFTGDLLGGLVGDRLSEWRTRNLVSSASKTAEFLKAKGIPLNKAKALPMGEMYEMFDGMSKAEAPEIRNLYSALLANAINPESDVEAEKSFISLIQQLSPKDAAILEFINYSISADEKLLEVQSARYEEMKSQPSELSLDEKRTQYTKVQDSNQKEHELLGAEKSEKFNDLGLDNERGNETSIQNLLRLGLITVNIMQRFPSSLRNLTISTDIEDRLGGHVKLLDAPKTIEVLSELSERIRMNSGEKFTEGQFHNIRTNVGMGRHRLSYVFTAFGTRFVKACSE